MRNEQQSFFRLVNIGVLTLSFFLLTSYCYALDCDPSLGACSSLTLSPSPTPSPTPIESTGSFSPAPGDLVTNPVLFDWSGRTTPPGTTEFLVLWYAYSTDVTTGKLIPELIGAERTSSRSITAPYDNKGSAPGSWLVYALNSQGQQIGYVIGRPEAPEPFQLYGNGPNIKYVKDRSITIGEQVQFNVELDEPIPTPTPAPNNLCTGHCGPNNDENISYNSSAECWCDRMCEDVGDCCNGWDNVRSYCGYEADLLRNASTLPNLNDQIFLKRLRNAKSNLLGTVRQCIRQSLRRYKRSKRRHGIFYDRGLSKRKRRKVRKRYRKQCVQSVSNNIDVARGTSFRDIMLPDNGSYGLLCEIEGQGEVPCPDGMNITTEGAFSYTPQTGDEAAYLVKIIATDPLNNALMDTLRFLLTVYLDNQVGVGPAEDLSHTFTHAVEGGPSQDGVNSVANLIDHNPGSDWIGKSDSENNWMVLFKVSVESESPFLVDSIQFGDTGSVAVPRSAVKVYYSNDPAGEEQSFEELPGATVATAPGAFFLCGTWQDFTFGCNYEIQINQEARYILLEIAGGSQPRFNEVTFYGWEDDVSAGHAAQEINTCQELVAIDDNGPAKGSYVITQNLDCQGVTGFPVEVDTEAEPPFTLKGVNGGNTPKILNLHIEGEDYVGLFDRLGGNTKVLNLEIPDAYVSGNKYVGILAGSYGSYLGQNCDPGAGACESYFNYSTVEDVVASGTVIGDNYVGGLIGYSKLWTIINSGIEKTSSNQPSTIIARGDYLGGLVGNNSSILYRTFSKANVLGCESTISGCSKNSKYVGGLAGVLLYDGTIIESYALGMVRGVGNVGGLVGQGAGSYRGETLQEDFHGKLTSQIPNILDSYFKGTVDGTSTVGSSSVNFAGGLVGRATADFHIKNSYAHGTILNEHAGGLVGQFEIYDPEELIIEDSFASMQIINNSDQSTIAGQILGKNRRHSTPYDGVTPRGSALLKNVWSADAELHDHVHPATQVAQIWYQITQECYAASNVSYFSNWNNYPIKLWDHTDEDSAWSSTITDLPQLRFNPE